MIDRGLIISGLSFPIVQLLLFSFRNEVFMRDILYCESIDSALALLGASKVSYLLCAIGKAKKTFFEPIHAVVTG